MASQIAFYKSRFKQFICLSTVASSDLHRTAFPHVHHTWSLVCCFTLPVFWDFSMILQRPSSACLHGNLGTWGGNTGSSHDSVKSSPELCHYYPIEHITDMTHAVSQFQVLLKSQFFSFWPVIVNKIQDKWITHWHGWNLTWKSWNSKKICYCYSNPMS